MSDGPIRGPLLVRWQTSSTYLHQEVLASFKKRFGLLPPRYSNGWWRLHPGYYMALQCWLAEWHAEVVWNGVPQEEPPPRSPWTRWPRERQAERRRAS
jgi:hypothetical protein